tara:strand:- start:18694 stop:19503 length:810 start_codon:yes stop_codon:yes gene_type:complete
MTITNKTKLAAFLLILSAFSSTFCKTVSDSACSPALANLKALDQKVRNETLLESIGLLLVMSKKTLKTRIEQIPKKELQSILPRIETITARLEEAKEDEQVPTRIKESIDDELLGRIKYIKNRIKEILRQYHSGERGSTTSKFGHAGTSSKSRGKQKPTPPLEPKEPSKNKARSNKKKSTPSCRQKAETACSQINGQTLITPAVVNRAKNPPNSGVTLSTYNFNPGYSNQTFFIHQDKSIGVKPGDIVCVYRVLKNGNYAMFQETGQRC